jgi:choline dehydrogenase
MTNFVGWSAMREADYVIVGAGTAGCVLADRLSQDRRSSVALIEAGGSDMRLRIRLPIGYGLSFYDPRVNWMYRTSPDAALDGRSGYWPRGRVLGGSGSINAMVHIRGLPSDYDDWASAGNAGWSWQDVRPYFARAMTRIPGEDVSGEVHPLCRDFLAAGAACGYPICDDFNSSARAYLRPASGRSNLAILKNSLATRVLFEGKRAVAVEIARGNSRQIVRARKEVVLCAGSIESPKLLQLSGIGPGRLLSEFGIVMVSDAPAVGCNMQDHLCIDHLYRARVPTLNQQLGPWLGKIGVAIRYALSRRGPLALSVNQAGGFVRSREGVPRPDMQLYFSPLSYTRVPAGVRPLMRPDPFPGFLLSAQPCRPSSRGRIEIASSDFREAPAIHPNSLSDGRDLEALLVGSRLLRRLSQTAPLSAAIADEMQPGPSVRSDDQLVEDIRRRAGTVFHPVSTCRMASDPSDGVVDARLRVHGLEGLRIADASVFPFVTSGNTNLPTLMVAEKAADLILGKEAAIGTMEN